MASQETKFIDVTRTYIPVNPNAFPDSLHTQEKPEERVPVMAYKGYNFLPTAYGYRSYFGIGQDLGISAIAERVDHVFVYQNNSFENILIALCDSGIWYKAGDVAGAWAQILPLPDFREGVRHFTWTFCIINDALYCYRQNGPSYQKFVSSASAPGFTMTSVVPNFLNMAAQQGIFRAGARLGFWDSSDATAWSNLDNFADFTPSIETLANITTFSSVVGRIVTIKSHGDGFMIYGTKSAVYIAENPESLFQWDPSRTLDVAGIAYPHEVVAGVPDTTHYMYSSVGLYQIKNAIAEIIIPEVTDYFKESSGPKYLRFLEGRYLAFQSLDANYINGVPQFSDEEIPATIITFPGANLNLAGAVKNAQTQGGQAYCPIFGGLSGGAYNQPEGRDPSVVWRPLYTAYLSSAGEINPDVEWTTNPCSVTNVVTGVPYAMTPSGTPTFNNATTGTAGKREVTGAEAYVDGVWTIERFTQAQLAIWNTQQTQLAAKLSAILGRTHTSTKTYENPAEVTSYTATACDIGRYVTAYSGARFGFSKCEFWLTRFAIAAADLKVRKSLRITSVFVPEEIIPPVLVGFKMGASFSSMAPACTSYYPDPVTAWNTCAMAVFSPPGYGGYIVSGLPLTQSLSGIYPLPQVYTNGTTGHTVVGDYTCPAGYTINGTIGNGCKKAAYWQVTEQAVAYIEALSVPIAPTPETGTCKLTSWKDIVSGTVIPAGTCVAPSEVGNNKGSGPPIKAGSDGSLCSQPFPPFIIPGTPPVTVFWPDQSVTIPSGSFFLQDGSAEPLYPTFEGAWIYDTHLKKWGIYKGRHKQLLDYSPINSYGPSSQSYARFGIMGGILAEGGKLYLFDSFPSDSYITYGKVGYYRQGVTSIEEIHISMKQSVDCTVTVETSLEGTNLTTGLSKSESYVAATKIDFYGGYTGRWHNITIAGRFDISYLEFRGIKSGLR